LSPSLDHKGDKTLDDASFFALICLLSNNGRGQLTIGRNGISPVPKFSKCSSTAQSGWSLCEVYGMQTSLCTVLNWTIATYVYHLICRHVQGISEMHGIHFHRWLYIRVGVGLWTFTFTRALQALLRSCSRFHRALPEICLLRASHFP
jgi:hypothetical protein